MRAALLAALVAMPALVVAPSAAQSSERGLAADVRAALERIPEAFVEGVLAADWQGVAELYHEDAVQMPPDAPAVEGREAIRQGLEHALGPTGGVELSHFSVEVREAEASGDLVYVRAAYRLRGTLTVDERELPFAQTGAYVNILRQDEAGEWRIHRQIYNRDHPLPERKGTP